MKLMLEGEEEEKRLNIMLTPTLNMVLLIQWGSTQKIDSSDKTNVARFFHPVDAVKNTDKVA